MIEKLIEKLGKEKALYTLLAHNARKEILDCEIEPISYNFGYQSGIKFGLELAIAIARKCEKE